MYFFSHYGLIKKAALSPMLKTFIAGATIPAPGSLDGLVLYGAGKAYNKFVPKYNQGLRGRLNARVSKFSPKLSKPLFTRNVINKPLNFIENKGVKLFDKIYTPRTSQRIENVGKSLGSLGTRLKNRLGR